MKRYQTVFECDVAGCDVTARFEGQAGDGDMPVGWSEVTVDRRSADGRDRVDTTRAVICHQHTGDLSEQASMALFLVQKSYAHMEEEAAA